MAHVVAKLFKAIIVFSNRVTIYSNVISLTADQLKTQSVVRGAGALRAAHINFPSNQETCGYVCLLLENFKFLF